MKKLIFAAFVTVAFMAMTAAAQVKSVAAANSQVPKANAPQNPTNASRSRVLKQAPKQDASAEKNFTAAALRAELQADLKNHSEPARFRRANSVAANPSAVSKSKPSAANTPNASSVPAVPASSSQVYRIGIRDVLDIQLTDNPSRGSTLFTVLEGGLLEYPLISNAVSVAGLTTSEVAALLRTQIKILENPAVAVSVRDYASHAVSITGFVASPGTKTLRREAMPLYALLAEALVLPEAARATITRQGRPIVVDLKDANLSAMLIVPGDVIKVMGVPAQPTEFFFIGGEISSPGQKPYHAGLTLTQSILASGGLNRSAGEVVRVSRQGVDGRLVTQEHNLRKIQTGKLPDPAILKDDRIEVSAEK